MEVGKYYKWSMWDKMQGVLLVEYVNEKANEVRGTRFYPNGTKEKSRHYLGHTNRKLYWVKMKAYNSPLWKVMND